MRVSDYEVQVIKDVINYMDSNSQIYLFGSRTDDAKKGGDIDLLILSERLNQSHASVIKYKMCEILGDQKIDVVIEKDDSKPFTRIALKEGIRL